MPSDHGLQETNPPLLLKIAFSLPVSSPQWLNINGSIILLQCHPNASGTPASLRKKISKVRERYSKSNCYLNVLVGFLGKGDAWFSDTCKTTAACRVRRKRLLSKTILSQLWRRMIFLITSLCSVSCNLCRSASFMKTCSVKVHQ